uniref:Uncharacterized protein n=1 Tax=Timema genevievae TaxID=629358 RepID=A0A7R9PPF3_TIMGE|nr:unnamed protein product [Timema genevievae]
MATKSGPDRPETEDQQRLRFQVELDTNTLGEKWSIHSVQDLLTINKYFCGNITPEGGQEETVAGPITARTLSQHNLKLSLTHYIFLVDCHTDLEHSAATKSTPEMRSSNGAFVLPSSNARSSSACELHVTLTTSLFANLIGIFA